MGAGASSGVKPLRVEGEDLEDDGPVNRTPGSRPSSGSRSANESRPSSGSRPESGSRSSSGSRPPSGSRSSSGSRRVQFSNEVEHCEPVQPFQTQETALEIATASQSLNRVQLAELRVQELETQVAEVESENLDLQDLVQALQERLELEHAESVAKDDNSCEETVKAKDSVIQTLKTEIENLQKELHKLKVRYKKKLKVLIGQLAEAKHEGSLQVFEMRDEVTRLKEENAKLAEELSNQVNSSPDRPPTAMSRGTSALDSSGIFDGSRTKIIVELSAKVSEQDGIIQDLTAQLQKRDETIESLKSEMKALVETNKGQKSTSDNSTAIKNNWSKFGGNTSHVSGQKDTHPSWTLEDEVLPLSDSKQRFTLLKKQQRQTRNKQIPELHVYSKTDEAHESSRISNNAAKNYSGTNAVNARNSSSFKGSEKRISSAASSASGFSDCDSVLSLEETGLVTVAELSDNWDDSDEELDSPSSFCVKPPEAQKTKLNPANVRKISAPKGRRRKQEGYMDDISMMGSTGRPPKYGLHPIAKSPDSMESASDLGASNDIGSGLHHSRTVAVTSS